MSAALVKLADALAGCTETEKTDHPDASIWAKVENTARQLANGLRTRGETEDHHGIVGATSLPRTLTTLLNSARGTSDGRKPAGIPQRIAISAAYELLRVGANICMDHDTNRGRLLAASYPQTVLGILESYSSFLLSTQVLNSPSDTDFASCLSLEDFKVIKTAFGVLLNASMGYQPVRSALLESKAPGTILRLTSLIYPAGLWLRATSSSDDKLAELWTWRSGLSAWSWRAIDTLRPTETDIAWDEEALPYLIKSLDAFSPRSNTGSEPAEPYPPIPSFVESRSELRLSLLSADMDVVSEVCTLVEALTLDEERVRALLLISTGKSSSPTSRDSPFVHLIRFIESAGPLPYWTTGPAEQRERPAWEKSLGLCKAAVIKAIVTVAGEDSQMDVLWGPNDPHGGWFVEKMLTWIKEYPASKEARNDEERDDLIICATLCLGNLARREARCVALVEQPISIVPYLVPLLTPSSDIKLKHGVLALLKNLAQTQPIREPLGRFGVIEAICKSNIWGREGDIADMVQLSAIGAVKHLSTGHIINALKLFVAVDDGSSGLEQILDLIRRTDSLPLRNESTRVLVNLIKTLWIPPPTATSPVRASNSDLPPKVIEERRKAFDQLCSEEAADALAEMIGRNARYPVLLNEGIMALTLLAAHPSGVPHVVTALVSALGPDMPASVTRSPPISEASTSTSLANEGSTTTATALDMVTSYILSPKGRLLPPELRANSCSLLTSVGRRDVAVDATDTEKVEMVENIREAARPALVSLANEPVVQVVANDTACSPPMSPVGGPVASVSSGRDPNLVRTAATRALAAWGTPVSSPSS